MIILKTSGLTLPLKTILKDTAHNSMENSLHEEVFFFLNEEFFKTNFLKQLF